MSWLLEVKDQHSLGFGIDEDGAASVYGDATSTIFNGGRNHPLLPRVRDAVVSWSIIVTEASDLSIGGTNPDLIQRVRAYPDRVHGSASFYKPSEAHNSDLIGFTIVVPLDRFEKLRHMFELALLARVSMEHIIRLPFYGFREAHGQGATPSWHEFIGGAPLSFDNVSVTGRRLID